MACMNNGVGTLVPFGRVDYDGTKVPAPRAEESNGTEVPCFWREI